MKKIVITLLTSFLLSGCVGIAPTSNTTSARPLDKGGIGFEGGGTGQFGYFVRLGYGLTQKTDAWLVGEYGFDRNYGLMLKQAFFDAKNPLGFSIEAAGGVIVNRGHYYYAGPKLSYKYHRVEPFVGIRFNQVVHKDTFFRPRKNTYQQYTVGSTFWFTEKIGLNLNISAFKNYKQRNLLKEDDVFAGLGLTVRSK